MIMENKSYQIKIKKLLVDYLKDEYPLEEALQQVCYSDIEAVNAFRVTYENGVSELLEIDSTGKLIKAKD